MSSFRPLVQEAVRLAGSQQKLADAAGCSQQQISYLLHQADRISAEMAVSLEKATDGQISRNHFRPDVFGPPPSSEAAA
ncbi:YdaS family helix-turn-helix protein [Aureimonas phyllosphaerae]|uniref:YdaS family helix-turn-helix protein n=1 Tax=Aureimonas phyllosphaerae TaxID=1166078 RepID=UPI003A5C32A8